MNASVPAAADKDLPLREDIRLNPIRRAEQAERLIDQMRAQVIEHTVAFDFVLAPPVRHGRPISIPARVECIQPAEPILSDEFSDREEGGVPTTIVKHRKHSPLFMGERDQFVRL